MPIQYADMGPFHPTCGNYSRTHTTHRRAHRTRRTQELTRKRGRQKSPRPCGDPRVYILPPKHIHTATHQCDAVTQLFHRVLDSYFIPVTVSGRANGRAGWQARLASRRCKGCVHGWAAGRPPEGVPDRVMRVMQLFDLQFIAGAELNQPHLQ